MNKKDVLEPNSNGGFMLRVRVSRAVMRRLRERADFETDIKGSRVSVSDIVRSAIVRTLKEFETGEAVPENPNKIRIRELWERQQKVQAAWAFLVPIAPLLVPRHD